MKKIRSGRAGRKNPDQPRIRGDLTVLVCCGVLLLLGVLMAGSIANREAFNSFRDAVMTVVKQLIFAGAFFLMYLLAEKLFSWKIFGIALIPLLLVYFGLMGVVLFAGTETYGARSWISVGFFTLQPSELFKPLVIALSGWSVHRCRKKAFTAEKGWKNMLRVFWLPLLASLATAVLLVFQKDFGTMIIIFFILVSCFLIPSMNCLTWWQNLLRISLVVVIGLAAGLFFVTDLGTEFLASMDTTSHIATRIENVKDPYTDVYEGGYQSATGLYALADSNIVGKGYGNSERKYGFLTQAESDFILVIMVEELGVFGLAAVVICYFLLAWRLFYFALQAREQGDKVVLGGTAAYFLLHFFINVGGVGGLIPLTGVPLLLISAGGSSILSAGIAVGVAQNRIIHVKETALRRTENKARDLMEAGSQEMAGNPA